jgi:hypothetical protein
MAENIVTLKDTERQEADKNKVGAIIGNARLWEYCAQIKIDGHDPADILEAWLKEHNPEFLEDD